MAERNVNKYVRLFELRLLHHYWLDEGSHVFDTLSDTVKKQRLLEYDVERFLTIAPTASTAKALKQFKCLYKSTSLGCFVSAPQDAVLPLNLKFEFVVSVKNPMFLNYTALTLAPQKIYEIFNSADNKIYRYKENVAVFSNLTGTTRGTGVNKTLYLSKEFTTLAAQDKVESLYKNGSALMQLNSDQPDANPLQLNANIVNSPVFAHQVDIPVLTPPAGLSGVPARGIGLTSDINDDIFALIQLTAVNNLDTDFSFVDGAGLPKTSCPTYQVRLKSHATTRKYIKKQTGLVDAVEPNSTPLTFYGNAGIKQKPENTPPKIEMSGSKVTRIVSEIFI